jgi:hypothetical protein
MYNQWLDFWVIMSGWMTNQNMSDTCMCFICTWWNSSYNIYEYFKHITVSSVLKMVAVCSLKLFVPTYQTTIGYHNTGEQGIQKRITVVCFPCLGFGGLVVRMLASGTQHRGFDPGQSRRIFRAKKIHSMPSFGGEVKPSVPVADLRHVKEPCDLCRSQNRRPNWPAISRPIPSVTNSSLSCSLTWNASGDDGQN